MDLYLPDEFYELRESLKPQRATPTRDDREWFGGEAFLTHQQYPIARRAPAEPDPIWLVV